MTNKFEALSHLQQLWNRVDSDEDIEAINYLRQFINERK